MEKLTAQPIKPEDIRVGDRIRIEWMAGDILRAETGTVAEIDADGDLTSQAQFSLGPAYIKDCIRKGKRITITLLDRPNPKLPTEVGSVIHVSECYGLTCDTLAMLREDGWWYTPVPMEEFVFHKPSDITAWEPRAVVEVQA